MPTTVGFRLARDLSNPPRRRPLEEHVLEDVSDSYDIVRLVEVSSLHVRDDCNDRG